MTPSTTPLMPVAKTRVLVVEDDHTILANVVEYLEAQELSVDCAHDGNAAMMRLASHSFDLVVLDLGLPRADGLQVLQHLRHVLGLTIPVLVLTARDALSSKLDAFSLGADDYLLKPFALAELAARLIALDRRAKGATVTELRRAGALTYNRRTREVRVHEQAVKLMPRSMQILDILLRDPGRMVTREELETALWPDDLPGADALRSQIHLLRQALVQAGFDGLETIHGVGYRLRVEMPPANTGLDVGQDAG